MYKWTSVFPLSQHRGSDNDEKHRRKCSQDPQIIASQRAQDKRPHQEWPVFVPKEHEIHEETILSLLPTLLLVAKPKALLVS